MSVDVDGEAAFLDGNAVGGVFAEVFRTEVSAIMLTCATCGRAGRFADQRVYARGPGVVARCPYCGEVNARMVRTPTEMWLDLRGSSSWRISVPSRS
jgi:hypothetical protein